MVSQITSETRSNDAFASLTPASGTTPYGVNGLNQYSSVGGTTQTYDDNGNLTGDGTKTYTYDIENRLVKAVAGSTTTNVVYDPLGRLFEFNQGNTSNTRRFVTDGDAIVNELNGSNALAERFVHGSNAAADDPLLWYANANAGLASKQWLHSDHLGSIVARTASDGSGGNPVINKYDEYGTPASSNGGRFQYTGQVWISQLGLYYYKARFYSPGLGRFMQTDPVGYDDQINLYEYVGADPINSNDPSGDCPECLGFFVGVGLEAANQYISTGKVDVSRAGLAKLAIAGVVGASGVGIGGQVAKVIASFAARAALNAAAGAALGAGQTAANAKVEGKTVSAADVARGAAVGGVAGAAGSAVADASRGSARVLAEHTGVNIATKSGQVATPTASSTQDAAIRRAADVRGNIAQALPSTADAVRQRISCSDPTKCR